MTAPEPVAPPPPAPAPGSGAPATPATVADPPPGSPSRVTARPVKPPQPVAPPRSPYAGIVTRGVAGVLDAVVVSVAYLLSLVGILAVKALLLAEPVTQVEMEPWLAALLLPGLLWGYFAGGWWLFGKTVGSLVLGTRVVRADGHRIGFLRAWLRFVATGLSTVCFGLGWAWIAVDRRNRAWHDIIARTVVVYDWDEAHPQAKDVALPD